MTALTADQAATATNTHYDQAPDAFVPFLDRNVKYTCGLYGGGAESLDDAQDAHLRYITGRLGVTGGEHVLDIGCGWGSLTIHLATQHGCRVHAVTPSRSQADFITERAARAGVADLVDVHVTPFQLADLTGLRFDAVAMVEVIEHLPEHRQALQKVFGLLKQKGRLFLSAFCYRRLSDQLEYQNRPASRHAVELFGFTAMVPLSALVTDLEDSGFSLYSLADTTASYDTTMEHWQQRIRANHARMERSWPGFADELQRYLDTARASWGHTAKLYNLTAVRSRMGSCEVP